MILRCLTRKGRLQGRISIGLRLKGHKVFLVEVDNIPCCACVYKFAVLRMCKGIVKATKKPPIQDPSIAYEMCTQAKAGKQVTSNPLLSVAGATCG